MKRRLMIALGAMAAARPVALLAQPGKIWRIGVLETVSSDKNAANPIKDPVRPEDLAATIYYLLGIEPHTEVRGAGDRPVLIAEGSPVMGIVA